MRVIAGREKGRRLLGPKSEKIRPALDKIKQAVFNILGDVAGMRVLDLFAGTGSIGIEALSRGAREAVFVDFDPTALRLIRKNLEICRFITPPSVPPLTFPPKADPPLAERGGMGGDTKIRVIRLKIPHGISRLKEDAFDLIFVDPPYDRGLVNPTLQAIARGKILGPHGTVVVEHSPREGIGEETDLRLVDQRKYGQTLISFLRIP